MTRTQITETLNQQELNNLNEVNEEFGLDQWEGEDVKLCDLVYPVPRYHDDRSPMCLYIPSPLMLFKLMRACIGVEKITELWIYNQPAASEA